MKFTKLASLAVVGALSVGAISGCTAMRNVAVENSIKDTNDGQDPKKVEAFENKFTQVLDDVGEKDDYKKLPLDGMEETQWFIKQSFALWDKKQTREQYISNGEKKFPGYKKTLEYLADEFTK